MRFRASRISLRSQKSIRSESYSFVPASRSPKSATSISGSVASTTALAWRWRLPQRVLALLVFGLLIAQAVLGGLTVLIRLDILVVALHQAFALIFFGALVTLTVLVWQLTETPAADRDRRLLAKLLSRAALRRSIVGD